MDVALPSWGDTCSERSQAVYGTPKRSDRYNFASEPLLISGSAEGRFVQQNFMRVAGLFRLDFDNL